MTRAVVTHCPHLPFIILVLCHRGQHPSLLVLSGDWVDRKARSDQRGAPDMPAGTTRTGDAHCCCPLTAYFCSLLPTDCLAEKTTAALFLQGPPAQHPFTHNGTFYQINSPLRNTRSRYESLTRRHGTLDVSTCQWAPPVQAMPAVVVHSLPILLVTACRLLGGIHQISSGSVEVVPAY